MLLKGLYSNHMVFQQQKPLSFQGFYNPFEAIHIQVEQDDNLIYSITTQTDQNGKLNHEGPILQGSKKPIRIIVQSRITEVLYPCFIGDIFLGMGQSNMAYPLKYDDDHLAYMDELQNHNISMLHISDSFKSEGRVIRPLIPLNELQIESGWIHQKQIDQVLNTSGLLWMAAIEYAKHVDYPIGIIDVSVGGCAIHGFLSEDMITKDQNVLSYLKEGQILTKKISEFTIAENHYTIPSGIFNEKVNPIVKWPIKAFLWYQGEHHVGAQVHAEYYHHALKSLIFGYRQLWEESIPWINIQIRFNYYPNDDGFGIARINEAIQKVASDQDFIYVIPTHDILPNWQNSFTDETALLIHPTNKSFVAKRIIRTLITQTPTPEITSFNLTGNRIIIHFKNTKELESYRNPIEGFTISGDDLIYLPAEARIVDHNQIEIQSSYIKSPTHFTYGFELDNHQARLTNEAGIPIPIFRSHPETPFDQYYRHYGYEYCNKLSYLDPSFDTRINTSVEKLLFKPGVLHPLDAQKILLLEDETLHRNVIVLDTLINNHPYPTYYGMSIDSSKTGQSFDISRFPFITLSLKTDQPDVMFEGLSFKGIRNQTWGAFKQTLLSTVYQNITIDLRSIQTPDMISKNIAMDEYLGIKDIEFVFKSSNPSRIFFKSIQSHY